MQMIGSNKGVRYYDVPFSVFAASYRQLRGYPSLPVRYFSQFTSVSEDEETVLKSYIEALLDGRMTCNNPWKFWNSEYDFSYNRVLLKILAAKPLINWIDTNFDVDTVCLLRHPIPTALSVLQRGWGNTSRAYLSDSNFCKAYLSSELLEFAMHVYREGTPFAKAILNWCLDNAVPLSLFQRSPAWVCLTYEGLIIEPVKTVTFLCERLGLRDTDRMLKRLQRPSSTAKGLQLKGNGLAAREALVSKWQDNVSSDMSREAAEILERFNVTLYRANCTMPIARMNLTQ